MHETWTSIGKSTLLVCVFFMTNIFAKDTTPATNTPSTYEINIGSGGQNGLYYPVASDICSIINKNEKQLHLHCTNTETQGSVDNINRLRQGSINFGIIQSDLQYFAYKGVDDFAINGPFSSMRAVLSLHGEPFTLIVKENSDIKNINDLKGKRINMGNKGSGQRATMERLMAAMKWSLKDFSAITDLNIAEEADALCDGKIDAFMFTVGHPNSSIKDMALTCPIRILPIKGDDIKLLTQANPFYVPMTIAADLYKGNRLNIDTFGVQATLVTTDKVPDWVSYNLTKAIFEHFNQFKHAHPSLIHLTYKNMMTGNSAPYSMGTLNYFRQKAWILDIASQAQ